MPRNRPKLYRLTNKGLKLVKETLLSKHDSINAFCEAKKFAVHRGTFTKFYDGEGVEKDTAVTFCNLLEIPNWQEDWENICEIVIASKIG